MGDQFWNGDPRALRGWIDTVEMGLSVYRAIDAQYLREHFQCPLGSETTGVDIALGDAAAAARARDARKKYSLLRSAADSFCAMVVSVPSIEVSTTAGTYAQRRSAELLGAFDDGVLRDNDMEALAWQCVVDAFLARVGGVLVEVDAGGRIRIRRGLPHQIVYNPMDGQEPANLAIRMPVSKSALATAFPAQADRIMTQAPAYQPDPMFIGIDGYTPELAGDLVLLERGWHLADPGNPESGRHVALVGDIVLPGPKGSEDKGDPWPHEWHPFVPIRFDYAYSTFGGKPAADTIDGYQAELDEFSSTLREHFRISGKMRVLIDKESGIDLAQLNDVMGQTVAHNAGKAPQFDRGTAPPPEYLNREQQIIERCHDFLGLNYQIARGVKADGISSAKGQREVIQLAQNRQVLRLRTVQNWIVRIAETVNRVADAAYDPKDAKTDFVVKAPGSRYIRRIKWSELNFDKDLFTVKCDAINVLSRHPAARVEEVLELVQAKVLDQRQGLKAISNKDLQFARDQAFAAEDYAERLVDLALRGDYRTPDPYAGERGLQAIIDRGQERYLAESVEDQPSEYLDKLRDLIEAAKATLEAMKPATPAPAPVAAAEVAMQPTAEDLAVAGAGLPAAPPAAAPPVPGAALAI